MYNTGCLQLISHYLGTVQNTPVHFINDIKLLEPDKQEEARKLKALLTINKQVGGKPYEEFKDSAM